MRVVIAHGASGSAASMAGHVDGLVARGLEAVAIDVPVRKAEDAVVAYREAASRVAESAGGLVIGGQSYGGRVASLLAAREPGFCAGLVLFSYPLHRPGRPDGDERTTHWPLITVPVLLLSGGSDPFARLDLLRAAVAARLPRAELVTYPRQGHSLRPVLDDALDRVAAFVAALPGWRPSGPPA